MRKRILSETANAPAVAEPTWLDLEKLATVEVSSEAPGYPIEAALLSAREAGWEAAEAGEQTVRLHFDFPQRLRRIRLCFREERQGRTQEFALGWSSNGDAPYQNIVRQQFHFSPPGTREEVEDYQVDLNEVKALELTIRPEIGGGPLRATLARLQIA